MIWTISLRDCHSLTYVDRVTYNHQHLSLLLIHAASRKTDRRPSLTAIKASLSVSSEELLTLLLSRLFASVCLLLSVSVLKFRSECAACIPRVPCKHNLHGQLWDLFTLVRMSLFASVCASYGLPSLVKWFVFLQSVLCAPVKWFR